MIAAFFSGDYLEFGEFPFNQLRLFFVDGAIVKISQKRREPSRRESTTLRMLRL